MKYHFRTTKTFRQAFDGLSASNQKATKEAFAIFKKNPFEPSLNVHKIYKLSGIAKKAVFSITIKMNLKVIFIIDGDTIVSLDIGTHAIYK